VEVVGEAVIARRDPSEVLEPSEHALDGVSVAIEEWGETAALSFNATERWN
jgi:hypothetical protein